jgi:hypothetical protein
MPLCSRTGLLFRCSALRTLRYRRYQCSHRRCRRYRCSRRRRHRRKCIRTHARGLQELIQGFGYGGVCDETIVGQDIVHFREIILVVGGNALSEEHYEVAAIATYAGVDIELSRGIATAGCVHGGCEAGLSGCGIVRELGGGKTCKEEEDDGEE